MTRAHIRTAWFRRYQLIRAVAALKRMSEQAPSFEYRLGVFVAQVLMEMSPRPNLQLVAFHSTSKGFLGGPGLHG